MRAPWTAVVVLALAAGTVLAQERPEGVGRGAARDEAFKMVDAYLVSNMQEALGLTDDQFGRLLPLVKRLQTDRREMAQRRFQAMGELRAKLGSGGATEQAVAQLLASVKKLEADEPVTLRRDMDAIDGALSPLQQAKFRVMQAEVERKIRQLLMRAREGQKSRRRGAREQQEP
jgi:hypothetical protein